MANTGRILLLALLTSASSARSQTVHVITIAGPIGPATAEFTARAIRVASEANSSALVIRLNTPGGLLQATRTIVSAILESEIPVIVYVSPAGAQAGSAGTFITVAGHVAAMAPGTNIGAAHPVGLQGSSSDSVMSEKATNDAAAFIRSIARLRNRNLTLVEDAVRKSISLSDSEAVSSNVVDLIAADMQDLLVKSDGMNARGPSGELRVSTSGASIVEIEPTFSESLLAVLSDPNIAYILFLLGVYGLMFELYNPGSILPGVVGGISLILAFYSLQTLPLNYAGAALIIFAVILFALELKVTSHGVLGIGGTIALLIGSVMLIDPSSDLEVIEISWSVILFAVAVTSFFFLFVLGLGLRVQRKPVTTGAEGIIGEAGRVVSPLSPEGVVLVHGERWNARATVGSIEKGSRVRVVKLSGMTLTVEPIPESTEKSQ